MRKYRALSSILLYLLVFVAAARKDLAASEFLTAHGWNALISFGKHAGPLPMFLVPAFCFLAELIGATGLGILFFVLLIPEAQQFPIASEAGAKTARAGITMAFWSFLIIQAMKIIWGRPRFISLSDPSVSFEPWFHISGLVFTDDLYKSFPSGHTGAAAMIFWITLLPYVDPKLKKGRLWGLAIVYTALIAVSRIMAGMHYISDVMAGCAVTLSICQILRYRYFIAPEKEILHE